MKLGLRRLRWRVTLVVVAVVAIDFGVFLSVIGETRNEVLTLHYEGRLALLADTGALERCDADPAGFSLPDRGDGLVYALRPSGAPFDSQIDLGVGLGDLREGVAGARPGAPFQVQTSSVAWSAVATIEREGACRAFYMTPPSRRPGRSMPLARMALLRIVLAALMALALVIFIVRPLTRRIRRLATETIALAAGGFAGEVEVDSDEIGTIAAAFNQAASHAKTMIDAEMRQRELLHDLFADLSHDVRTPLASMKLSTDALSHGDDAAEVSRSLRAELEYLDAMFANLATIARLRSNVLPISLRPTDLCSLVERVSSRFLALASDRGVNVEFAVPEEETITSVDPLTIEQALGNVIHNAITFADAHVAVVLSCVADRIAIRVMDDGPGFDVADLARLTDRRFRGADQPSRGGLGLGLAIAEQILERHGGGLELAPRSGGGSEVTLRLPGSAANA